MARENRRGASIFFTDGKQVLILKRSKGGNTDRWCLPGGRSNPGENHKETALREAWEEIGHVEGRESGERPDGQWITYIYTVSETFDCILNDEHDQYEWVEFTEIHTYPLASYFEEEVDELIEIAENKELVQ